jgi:hypothetical protein
MMEMNILPCRGGGPRSGGGAQASTPNLAGQHAWDYSLEPLHQLRWPPSPKGED